MSLCMCIQSIKGLCVAFSNDTKVWTKPSLPNAIIPNTNIVIDQISDGMTVWRDDDNNYNANTDANTDTNTDTSTDTRPLLPADEHWVAAAVPEDNGCMAYSFWKSLDGIVWQLATNKSGPVKSLLQRSIMNLLSRGH